MLRGILGIRLDDLRIRWLQILSSRWLDFDDGVASAVAVDGRLAIEVR